MSEPERCADHNINPRARRMRLPMDHDTGDGTCREYKRAQLRGHHTCRKPINRSRQERRHRQVITINNYESYSLCKLLSSHLIMSTASLYFKES